MAAAEKPAPTILALYMSVGSGHRFAAEALKSALEQRRPGVSVHLRDLGEASRSRLMRWLPALYGRLLRVAPRLYDRAWDSPAVTGPFALAEGFWRRCNEAAARRLIEDLTPDLLVCTHALPARAVAALKRQGAAVPLLCVPTDLGLHPYWPIQGADAYSVGAEALRKDLVERGFPGERISVLGIPLRLAFAEPTSDRERPGSPPRALLLGGARDQGPYGQVVRELAAVLTADPHAEDGFRAVVVTGTNARLKAALESRRDEFGQATDVLGFVDDMHRLMDDCDLLVTKPGGLIVSEALAKGLPMVLMGPPVGQERANMRLLVSQGAAVEAEGPRAVRHAICRLAGDPEGLREMSRRARALGHPDSALAVANLALSLATAAQPAG